MKINQYVELDVEIPAGWRAVCVRKLKKGDYYLIDGQLCIWNAGTMSSSPHVIVEQCVEFVPLGPSDIKPGSIIKYCNDPYKEDFWEAILTVKESYVVTTRKPSTYQQLMETYPDNYRYWISFDFGATWRPCRKEKK